MSTRSSAALGRSRAAAGDPDVTVPRSFGALTLVLAAALLLNTLLGPLGLGVISYDLPTTIENQLVGLELVTVLLVAPFAAVGGVLALRNRLGAPLLVIGPAAYSAYMFVQYVLGPEYDHYSLTALFHLALVTLSGGLALWAWSLARTRPVPAVTGRQRRRRGLLLLFFAAFVVLRYVGALTGAFTGAGIDPEFAHARTFYWSIVLLDLAAVVPLTVAGAVASLRGAPAGDRAVPAVVGWFALVPPSVAAMSVVMLVRNDPNASAATTALLMVASATFGAAAVVVLRPLLRSG